jgi:putative transposase
MEVELISHRQACNIVNMARSSNQYQPKQKEDDMFIDALQQLISKHPSIGFWQALHRIRNRGYIVNHKKLYRIYTAMHLNIRRRAKKRLPARVKQQLFHPNALNQVWSIDFMTDSLWDGTRFRMLNILDDYNREVLRIEPDTSLPALRVIRVLEQLKECRGIPQMIRVDNGPEFISAKLDCWCKENKIELMFIQPGQPTQNAFIERLNGSIRRELLNAYVFKTLSEVRYMTQNWMQDYNLNRPHKSLGYKTPLSFLKNE